MASLHDEGLRTVYHNDHIRVEHLKPLCQISTPVGMLGYGFDENEFDTVLQYLTCFDVPSAIILDSGSTDSGPSKLATGISTCPRASYKRDLTRLLKALMKYGVPLLISSAGGDGSDHHVDECIDIIREIMSELHKKLKVLAVYAQVSKALVLDRIQQGVITGCGPVVPPLTIEDVEKSPTIVAQMGPEPLLQAMTSSPDFDILIAGRAYDPAPYVAYCAFKALQSSTRKFESSGATVLGGFTHMGKIMECGGVCATPKSRGAVATVPPLRTGGCLDLAGTQYHQLEDDVSIRVRGARFNFTTDAGSLYTVKLEGARIIGYRTMFMGSIRDPILIGQLQEFLKTGRKLISDQYLLSAGGWKLGWHLTGLEQAEATPGFVPKKVFIVGEVLADTQELATEVAHAARVYCAHGPYPNQKGTSGNFAMGIGGKLDLPLGVCAEFSIYHLMYLEPGEEAAQEVTSDTAAGIRAGSGPPLFSWTKIFINQDIYEGREEANGNTKNPLQIQKSKRVEIIGKKTTISASPRALRDIAKVIRSKNAGPFEITFDIIFEDVEVYQAVKDASLLCRETIAKLYKLDSTDEILWCGFFDQALAFKATLPRTRHGAVVCSGGYMEDDVHGSQQYIPLMELPLSASLVIKLEELVRKQ